MAGTKAELYLDRTGRFRARLGDINHTGHTIVEDSGRYTVQTILAGSQPLSVCVTREQAEDEIAREWAIFVEAHMPETSRELDFRWQFLRREQWTAELRLRDRLASAALRPLLKSGDRLRARKAECGAREATFTFLYWEGGWIVSKNTCSIAPGAVYSINGEVFRV